jgi:DNA mismatch endonuclease (patch repair protein)
VSARARNRKPASLHIIRKARAKKHHQTGIESAAEQWLTEAGIEFRTEFAISRTHVDFYLPATKTIVEVHGCYWHACPKCHPRGTVTAKQLRWRRRDGRRYTFFRNAGYNLVILWEHEIEKEPDAAKEKVLKHASLA